MRSHQTVGRFVERPAPGPDSIDIEAFGAHAQAIDLIDTCAPYWEREPS